MAYRVVQQSFWTDEKVLDTFSVEDKYFYLYLLTNPQCNQLGVYKLPIKIAAFQLGYSKEQVIVLLERFEKVIGCIRYNIDTQEVAIGNYLQYSIIKGGKPVVDCITKDISTISDQSLLDFVIMKMEKKQSRNDTTQQIVSLLKEKRNKKEMVLRNDNDNDNDNDVSSTIRKRYVDDTQKRNSGKKFSPPLFEEVQAYCKERNNGIDAQQFIDFYTAKNWYIGKNKMKDWKAAVRTWEQRRKSEVQEVTPKYGQLGNFV